MERSFIMYNHIKKNQDCQIKKVEKTVENKHLSKPREKKILQKIFLKYMEDKKLKQIRLKECGNILRFLADKERKNFKLAGGVFCNNRFCPMCSWLKAKKTAFEILEILEFARVREKKEFIFMTLTAPNVSADKLSEEITDFNESFRRLFQTKAFKVISKGFIRKLEVTYNEERNDYHPHFHVIVAVTPSYFKSRNYISKKKLLEMWRKAKRDESITQVDVKKISMNSIQEVMEIATYSTKQSQLYLNKEVFDVFYNSLRGRQLLTFNKLFKELRRLQNLKELDLSELVDLNEIRTKAYWEIFYKWQEEMKNYEFDLEKEYHDEEFYNLNIDID